MTRSCSASLTCGIIKMLLLITLLFFLVGFAVSDLAVGIFVSDWSPQVVIVGAGVTGLTAADEVLARGAHRVILIEKNSEIGGNALQSVSGVSIHGTAAQARIGANDSAAAQLDDLLRVGGESTRLEMAHALTNAAPEISQHLSHINVDTSVVSRSGGSNKARTHRSAPPPPGYPAVTFGWSVVHGTLAAIKRAGAAGRHPRLTIVTDAEVTSLIEGHDGVVGAVYTHQGRSVRALGPVIIATGGFAANKAMVGAVRQDLAMMGTVATVGTDGSGLRLAEAVGADLVDLDKIATTPTAFSESQGAGQSMTVAPTLMRTIGGVLVNKRGRRFVNEDSRPSRIAQAVADNTVDDKAYLIVNEAAVAKYQKPALAFYLTMDHLRMYSDARQFCLEENVDCDGLIKTLHGYGASDPFGREAPVLISPSDVLYVGIVTPAVMATLGGIRVDPTGAVLTKELQPIPGLFAAGGAAAGPHGAEAVAGDILAAAIVFAKRAARAATAPTPIGCGLDAALAEIDAVLPGVMTTNETVLERHSTGQDPHPPVTPDAVAKPADTSQLAFIVRTLYRHRVPIVAYGAGSSLEAHVTPVNGGVSIDMSSFTDIDIDVAESVLRAGAGVLKRDLQEALEGTGLMFPVDPASNPTVGGMCATGASGTLAVRHGTMRELVVTMQVVMPNGDIIETGKVVKKSAAGYDLTHIMIGSEGTMGIITAATIRLVPAPRVTLSGVTYLESLTECGIVVQAVLREGINVARIEIVNSYSMAAVAALTGLDLLHQPGLFIEIHGSTEDEAASIARDVAAVIHREANGTAFNYTADPDERRELWAGRDKAYWANLSTRSDEREEGKRVKLVVTDTVVPVGKLSSTIEATERDFETSFLPCLVAGHAGDGNYHIMMPIDVDNATEVDEAARMTWRNVQRAIRVGGSCSGEHGVGLGKSKYLVQERGHAAVQTMRAIRRAVDPLELMNPGKIFM